MSLRQKILLMFSVTIVLTVAAVAWAVAVRVRVLFDAQDRDRTTALVSQFVHEYQRRENELAAKVERIARDERVIHMDQDLSKGANTSGYANQASALAQEYGLEFLEITQADGTIVSSAQRPADVGSQDASAAVVQPAPYLKREQLPGKSEIGLFDSQTSDATDTTAGLNVIAGERLDGGFVSPLSPPPGSMVYLYRNISSSFDSANLIGATGTVADAGRYKPLIDQVRSKGEQVTAEILRRNSEEQSVALTALPLKAADGSVAAVVLIANSRDALIETQEHIRAVAYGVAAIGILFAVMVSLWIAASVSRPIEQLAAGAREVSAGNWDTTVPVRSSADEIATLGIAFNSMTRELVHERERLVQCERVAAWREMGGALAQVLGRALSPAQLRAENMAGAEHLAAEMGGEDIGKGAAALSEGVHRVEATVADLKAFADTPKPQFERIDVREVIASVMLASRPRLAGRPEPIRLVEQVSSTPLMMYGDRELLERALSKLVMSAVGAMPNGGTLSIGAGRVGRVIALRISDTGEGMTEEECSRVFTPYESTRADGTGVGLAIVQLVVADHGGTVGVESAHGRGTTFRIDLPAAAPDDGRS